jgi:hypothetical protein
MQIIPMFWKKIKKEMNCSLREKERQPSKKRSNISSNSIFSFFLIREPFKKEDMQQVYFWEFLSVKNHLRFKFV